MVKETKKTADSSPKRRSLGIVRSVAWVTLLLVVASNLMLSFFIGNYARETFLNKNKNFASRLADNLNHQIYRRFTVPVMMSFGRIALRQPVQYRQLDEVVQSTTLGLGIENLRIFDYAHVVAYASDPNEIGAENLATPELIKAITGIQTIHMLESDMPYWKAMLQFDLPPNAFRLRTAYPLRLENRVTSSTADGPIMGVLEFSQDITDDVTTVIRFQWLIIVSSFASALVLFGLLIFVIRRSELALAARVKEEQRLNDELHQNEKLASMGRVIASIAHEIRNPLGIIRSSAELLLRKPSTDQLTGKILQAIYDESKRLSQTVSDFIDYARPRSPKQAVVHIVDTLDQVLNFLMPELEAKEILTIRAFDVHESKLCVLGDRDLLYRALYNIVQNAVQAIDHSGEITISAKIATQNKQDMLILDIADSGPGFSDANRDRLLDPFVTTKDGGTGLGLAIVNSIIASHQGTVSLNNIPASASQQTGGLVTVALPIHKI